MANKKSAAAQAIRDMQAAQLDVQMFSGQVRRIHALNIELGIVSNVPVEVVKQEIKIRVSIHNYQVPEALVPLPRKRYMRNPDGTIAVFGDWDND